jgi:2-C-methyl-D-erythritol 4-phosphate cytidylyltransferase
VSSRCPRYDTRSKLMAASGRPAKASIIIAAAGSGLRLGLASAKAFVELCGRPMLYYSLVAAARVEGVIEIVIAAPPGLKSAARIAASEAKVDLPVKITPGGITRQDSVRIALALTSAESDLVAVHDAARPLASTELFSAVLAEAAKFGGAIAAVPVADTLKRAEGEAISSTIQRKGLFQSQTPQAFRRALLVNAFEAAQEKGWNVTDDAELVERLGHEVRLVKGSPENFKITTLEDLAMAQTLAAVRQRTNG